MVWKVLAITIAFITAGAPWEKQEIEIPEPEPEVIEETITTPSKSSPAPAPKPEPKIEAEPIAEEVVAENTTSEQFGNPEQLTEGEWTHSASVVVTHYCNCSLCCGRWAGGPTSTGTWPVAGRTIAVDPSVIPYGSEVLINGNIYIAEDTGVKGYHIDIYCDSHSEALNRGMYTTTVYWR